MDFDPVLLSRIQFAFVVSFHIIFPAFTIGLAAWLATIEGMRLATGNPVYRRVFEFWRARAKPSAATGRLKSDGSRLRVRLPKTNTFEASKLNSSRHPARGVSAAYRETG